MRSSERHFPIIAIPAFDRPDSLQRLLNSLSISRHEGRPELIISIDGGAPSGTREVAKSASDKLPNFEVSIHEESHNLGLKRHILKLGNLAELHGSVIVLEDDLVVDPFFYNFAIACLEFYDGAEEIAGHALYSPSFNETASLPFTPMSNGFASYFMQVPCSWGQCWSAAQWRAFKSWLEEAATLDLANDFRLPPNVRAWPETSWKKQFAQYLVDKCRSFSYPYNAYTTNCSSPGGTHIKIETSLLHVPLATPNRVDGKWQLCPPGRREVQYDAYMEANGDFVMRALGLERGEVEIDLYGTKPTSLLCSAPLTATSRSVRCPKAAYPRQFRPVEMNLAYPVADGKFGEFALIESKYLGEQPPHPSLKEIEYWTGMRWNLWRLARLTRAAFRAFRGR